MTNLIPYLVFSGNCKEAMEFYAMTLNGRITSVTTFGESPIDVPLESKDRIFDCTLEAENIRFKASDDLPNHSVKHGSNFSLFLSFSNQDKKKEIFNKLSQGGHILFQLEDGFGMLKDKFGVQWMLVGKAK
ncbi:MAG: VOC family protein [Bacteroidota bacterium]